MHDREVFLQRLRDVHSFPTRYVFKVIGANKHDFPARVIQAIVVSFGPTADPDVELRESSHGRHVSVTVTISAPTAEAVLEAYDLLATVEGVSVLL